MNINIKFYEDAWSDFEKQCPMWAERAVECRPRHNRLLRVFLNDGDCVDYDSYSGTYTYISKSKIVNPDDVSDESFRAVFSENLSTIMKSRGITQSNLSELTGLSSAAIGKYLRKESTASGTAIKKIANALQCSPYELMG